MLFRLSVVVVVVFYTGKEHNFDKYNNERIDYLNEVYDTGSIMHYGKTSFSINGQPTIQAIGDPNTELGQRDRFSKTDIAQINALYDCSGKRLLCMIKEVNFRLKRNEIEQSPKTFPQLMGTKNYRDLRFSLN